VTQSALFPRLAATRASLPTEELIVDNFAGGGGASTGIELAMGRAVDIAINHDKEALEMHAANHPHTRHIREDVWAVDPSEVCGGRPVGLAWFSPDCSHHSKARGSKPKEKPLDKRIRALAWVAHKWVKAVRPRVIMLENVGEFEEWGPLDDSGMPCKHRKGQTFHRFVAQFRNQGYHGEWRRLNAKSHGAPTSRDRLFMVFRCDGMPICWPSPSHGKGLLPYRAAAECIDWHLEGRSIFNRPVPLKENTMRRIALGIKKFVLEDPEPFIVNTQHAGDEFRGQSLRQPFGTTLPTEGTEVQIKDPATGQLKTMVIPSLPFKAGGGT
jgi:DNA (cytosine-5)-methyltransferase 1